MTKLQRTVDYVCVSCIVPLNLLGLQKNKAVLQLSVICSASAHSFSKPQALNLQNVLNIFLFLWWLGSTQKAYMFKQWGKLLHFLPWIIHFLTELCLTLMNFPSFVFINILAYFTENIQKVSFIRTATCYLSLAVIPSYMNIRKNLGKCLHIAEK